MPFRLKEDRPPIRLWQPIHDLMHKEAGVNVDDMIVKSKQRNGHVRTLQEFYDIHLNPQKCAFGVSSR